MLLRDTVTRFSTEVYTDAFDSTVTLMGKLNPFAEVTNSGVASRRRIIETPYDVVIPADRVIVSPEGDFWIVGAQNVDHWNGSVVAYKYPLIPADLSGEGGSIGSLLAATPAEAMVYAYPYFVRREVDEMERSDYFSGYEIYMSSTISFSRGDILDLGSSIFRFRTDTWLDGAGYSAAQVVELESPFQTLDITTRNSVYDPATDTYGEASVPGVSCFVEPMKLDYEYVSPSFEQVQVGDAAISLLNSAATVDVNDKIGEYRVLAVRDFGTWKTFHCRKWS